jgi:hypothetical protein
LFLQKYLSKGSIEYQIYFHLLLRGYKGTTFCSKAALVLPQKAALVLPKSSFSFTQKQLWFYPKAALVLLQSSSMFLFTPDLLFNIYIIKLFLSFS